jgi:hypothetical protein
MVWLLRYGARVSIKIADHLVAMVVIVLVRQLNVIRHLTEQLFVDSRVELGALSLRRVAQPIRQGDLHAVMVCDHRIVKRVGSAQGPCLSCAISLMRVAVNGRRTEDVLGHGRRARARSAVRHRDDLQDMPVGVVPVES